MLRNLQLVMDLLWKPLSSGTVCTVLFMPLTTWMFLTSSGAQLFLDWKLSLLVSLLSFAECAPDCETCVSAPGLSCYLA